jgi:hypothetical protein
MKKVSTFTFGPVTGSGVSIARAREDAIAIACRALERLQEGTFLGCFCDVEFFVQPDIAGYSYGFMRKPDGRWAPRVTCHTADLRNDVIAGAVFHIATGAWKVGDDDRLADEAHDYLARELNEGLAAKTRQKIVDYLAWQRRYAKAIASGHTVVAAYDVASGLVASPGVDVHESSNGGGF